MIKKEDWEEALRTYRARLINTKVQMKADEYMVKVVEEEIAKLPDEDPMPDDVKEIAKEVK